MVQDAEEKAHEVFRGVDVETVDGLADWLKAKIGPRRPSPPQADSHRPRTNR